MMAFILLTTVAMTELPTPDFFAGNDELERYLLEAAENHPSLHARHAEWLAALERIPQVTSLDDPMLEFSYFVRSNMSRSKIMVSQRFPWFGTLRLRGEKAALDAEAALERFYAERNRIFADVKEAYFDYALLADRIRVTESQAEVLSYMEDVVEGRLALGLAAEDELLRISIDKARLQDQYEELHQLRTPLAARLNETLGCEVCEERPWPESAEFPPSAPPAPVVLARIRVANPDLSIYDHLAAGRRTEIELARKDGWPSFTIGLEYMDNRRPSMELDPRPPAILRGMNMGVETAAGMMTPRPFDIAMTATDTAMAFENQRMTDREGRDEIMVSVGLSLPIWRNRVRAGIAEARHRESAVRYEKRRTTLALDTAARQALFELQDAQRRHRLYNENLLPQAQRTYESLQSRYATGAGGATFLDVLDSIQTLLEFELEAIRAERDWHVSAAQLEYLMGGPWDGKEIDNDALRELDE